MLVVIKDFDFLTYNLLKASLDSVDRTVSAAFKYLLFSVFSVCYLDKCREISVLIGICYDTFFKMQRFFLLNVVLLKLLVDFLR